MAATLARRIKKKSLRADRHKPRRLVGIFERIALALEQIGANREATLTEMVRVACIEYLERRKAWPPKSAE